MFLSRFQMIRCVIMQIKTTKKSLQIPLKLNNENAVHLKSVIYYGNLQQIQKMKANKNVQNMCPMGNMSSLSRSINFLDKGGQLSF